MVVLGDTTTSDLWRENAAIQPPCCSLRPWTKGWVRAGACLWAARRKDDPEGEQAADYLRTFLPIPEGCEPLCVIALGYSDFHPAPLPETDDAKRIIRL